MKSIAVIAMLVFTGLLFSQEKGETYPKLNFEIGFGYEYAHLETFNNDFVTPIDYGDFRRELHSGWSLNIRTPLYFLSAIQVSPMFNYRNFRKQDDGKVAAASSNQTELMNLIRINNFEGGLQSTVYIDQFFKARKDAKFNFGLVGSGSFVFARYSSIQRIESQTVSYQNLGRELIPHWNASAGLTVKYNLNNGVLNALTFNAIYNFSTAEKDHNVDLSGFSTRLILELGK